MRVARYLNFNYCRFNFFPGLIRDRIPDLFLEQQQQLEPPSQNRAGNITQGLVIEVGLASLSPRSARRQHFSHKKS